MFVSSLRELSEYCDFGESLDHMLRDRLVCGIADERIQRRLLAERELSFAKAWDIARAMEDANKNAEEIQSGCSSTGSQATMSEVQYVQKRPGKSLLCYRCGESGHNAASCRFKSTRCFACKKLGHAAKACKSKGTPEQAAAPTKPQATHTLESDSQKEVGDERSLEYIHRINGNNKAAIKTQLSVNGTQLEMELDTGASVSVICEEHYRKIWGPNPPP